MSILLNTLRYGRIRDITMTWPSIEHSEERQTGSNIRS